MLWKRLATSNRVVCYADAYHLEEFPWRACVFTLTRLNRLLPKQERIHITDKETWDLNMVNHSMLTAALRVNAQARQFDCYVHIENHSAFMGRKDIIDHLYNINNAFYESNDDDEEERI
jgi:hypothetical protein